MAMKTHDRKPKKIKRRRRISIAQAVRIKEVTVRYGGVIPTGSYKNKRISFEISADVPRYVNIDRAIDYIEAVVANKFYEAQIKELDYLPEETRDEVGDIQKLTPGEAAAKIANFFRTFGSGKVLTKEEKAQRLKEIDKELKDVAQKIQAENKRLKKNKNVEGKDLDVRAALTATRDSLKQELKQLRRS